MAMKVNFNELDSASLEVIRYGDPRLAAPSQPIEGPFDEGFTRLVDRMFELMHQHHGVGLAAPQIGLNIRLFVACPSGEPTDRRVYINARLVAAEGGEEDEEGCLSVPGVHAKIKRYQKVTLRAMNPDGSEFEETGEGLLARIFQHEIDHLDGTVIVNRMGSIARLAHRRTLEELHEKYAEKKK